MTDKNADKPRRDEDKNTEQVKDLGAKSAEKDSEQVKGGRMNPRAL